MDIKKILAKRFLVIRAVPGASNDISDQRTGSARCAEERRSRAGGNSRGDAVGYLVPFFLRLRVGLVPLWFVTGIGSAAISYAFFRYTKVGRKPYWFQHSIRALLDGSMARRTLPADHARRSHRRWLLTAY